MKRKIEERLLAWKDKNSNRLPLIVNGARQVGKTYILRKFGAEQFKNVVYINLETITLYPLDFEEFLWARGREVLCEEIRRAYETMEPLPEALNQEAIELYREYLLIGGMPACILDLSLLKCVSPSKRQK